MTAAPSKRLTLPELEQAFNDTVSAFDGKVLDGIKGSYVNHEDGLPWFEVYGGRIGRKSADEFCQALADAMGCDILLNACSKESLKGVMDFDDRSPLADGAFPPLNPGRADEYGERFHSR